MDDPPKTTKDLVLSENAVVSGNKRSPSPTMLGVQPRLKRPRPPLTVCCRVEAVEAVQETTPGRAPKSSSPEFKPLDECILYVDVWMSHGGTTSPIFIDIAQSLGAKVIKQIGPECTHIVFTLGRQGTVEKYFALKVDQRPQVVGAAWLKDCNDAAMHLEEGPYLVDMEEYHTYSSKGVKRRRRTRKYHANDVGCSGGSDISMDSANAHLIDDTISVLEYVRNRRKTL
ncbi:hypothetical protein F5876DRAFT_65379 [Lentinula aff. lateritia]|uniref:Uncharacterized protein n=1 Tax=Lentinula aff. lateritia TaxID=2804960 RepID=A0ACC1U110_9AGAR|nr:hypothetical protein F5876DRAFT_65379 [Lentinula aff. lateritia]